MQHHTVRMTDHLHRGDLLGHHLELRAHIRLSHYVICHARHDALLRQSDTIKDTCTTSTIKRKRKYLTVELDPFLVNDLHGYWFARGLSLALIQASRQCQHSWGWGSVQKQSRAPCERPRARWQRSPTQSSCRVHTPCASLWTSDWPCMRAACGQKDQIAVPPWSLGARSSRGCSQSSACFQRVSEVRDRIITFLGLST